MRGDYLWDRSGRPDPEVVALERLLGPMRHRGGPLALPAGRPTGAAPSRWRPLVAPIALAAAIVSLGGVYWLVRNPRPR